MMTRRKRRILFWVSLSVFAFGAVPLVFFSMGYRYSFENGKILHAGALAVFSNPSRHLVVYIDGKPASDVGIIPRSVFIQGLTPKTYSIRIEKEGYHTWQKNLQVKPELVTLVNAELVPLNPVITPASDKQYIKFIQTYPDAGIVSILDKNNNVAYYSTQKLAVTGEAKPENGNAVPAEIQEILDTTTPNGYDYSESDERILWWRDHQVWIKWLQDEDFLPQYTDSSVVMIFETSSTIKRAQFLPGSESFVVSVGSKILDIELDGRGSRNTFQIYDGAEPDAIAIDGKTLLVLDNDNLFTIGL